MQIKTLANWAMKSRATKMLALAVAAGVASAGTAHAGTDTTFGTMNTKIEAWITGSLGVLLGLGGLMMSIISLMRQQWGGAAIGIIVALAGATGPAIIKGIFTGVI